MEESNGGWVEREMYNHIIDTTNRTEEDLHPLSGVRPQILDEKVHHESPNLLC